MINRPKHMLNMNEEPCQDKRQARQIQTELYIWRLFRIASNTARKPGAISPYVVK